MTAGQALDGVGPSGVPEHLHCEEYPVTFTMPSGHRVRAFEMGGGQTEFTTSNPDGEVISSVTLSDASAALTLRSLEANAR